MGKLRVVVNFHVFVWGLKLDNKNGKILNLIIGGEGGIAALRGGHPQRGELLFGRINSLMYLSN